MHYQILIILFAFQSAVLGKLGSINEQRRIIGGNFSPSLPFLVQLYISFPKEKTGCGGTLLTVNAAVTAAHCIYNCKSITAFFGSEKKFEGFARNAIAWQWHRNFDPIDLMNDIGVLVWKEALPWSEAVHPIGISSSPTVGEEVEVAGFGYTKFRAGLSDFLKTVKLTIEQNTICSRTLLKKRFFEVSPSDSYVCTNDKPSKGACLGDSGGPLYKRMEGEYYLIGIVSFGPEKCDRGADIYTSAFYHSKWIQKSIDCLLMKKATDCQGLY